MKTVFTNSMTAHVWAAQSQESGRSNNGQFYFEGRRLFSYGSHYCAAYALPRRNGSIAYLVNADSYSITTARHISEANYAIPGRAFYVPDLTRLAEEMERGLNAWDYPKAEGGRVCPKPRPATMKERREALPAIKRHLESNWPGEDVAAVILDAFGQSRAHDVAGAMGRRVAANAEKAEAARVKSYHKKLAEDARHIAGQTPAEVESVINAILAGHYCPEAKLKEQSARLLRAGQEAKRRGWTQVAEAVKARRAQVRAAVANIKEREAAARVKDEKRRAVAGLRHAIESAQAVGMNPGEAARAFNDLAQCYGALIRTCGAMLPAEVFARVIREKQAAEAVAVAKKTEAEAARMAAQFAYRMAWLAGSKERAPYGVGRLSCATGGALLRAVGVERDDSGAIVGGTLETSHGAQVPLAHALRVFAFLKHCRARGQEWRRNGATLRVGHFQVDSVAANGDFVAGCHRITWAEVARLSASLGVADTVAPADTTAHRATA